MNAITEWASMTGRLLPAAGTAVLSSGDRDPARCGSVPIPDLATFCSSTR